jgi:hypothetical protein
MCLRSSQNGSPGRSTMTGNDATSRHHTITPEPKGVWEVCAAAPAHHCCDGLSSRRNPRQVHVVLVVASRISVAQPARCYDVTLMSSDTAGCVARSQPVRRCAAAESRGSIISAGTSASHPVVVAHHHVLGGISVLPHVGRSRRVVRLVPCARRRDEQLWVGAGCTGEGHTIAEWRRVSRVGARESRERRAHGCGCVLWVGS